MLGGKQNTKNKPQGVKYITSMKINDRIHTRSLVELDPSLNTPHTKSTFRFNDSKEESSQKKMMNIFPRPAPCKTNKMQPEIKSHLVLKEQKYFTQDKSIAEHNSTRKSQIQTSKIKELEKQLEYSNKQANKLKNQIENIKKQKHILEEQFLQREQHLCERINLLQQKSQKKQKTQHLSRNCKQHELIIQSLKNVINEQLKKIIELQKQKIQKEQITKLEKYLSQNMSTIQTDMINNNMKIKEACSEQSDQQSIIAQSATKINQSQLEEDDSIVQQVGKYLSDWRSKKALN